MTSTATTTTDDMMMEQRDRFRLLEKIGKGSYGTVFKAYDCRDKNNIIIMNNNYGNHNNNHNDGIYNHDDGIANNNVTSSSSSDNNSNDYNYFVAIKIINLEDAADEIEQIHQEITIMSNISCPQLTKYHSSFITGMITNKTYHII
jgi:serine/threonine protein kinase